MSLETVNYVRRTLAGVVEDTYTGVLALRRAIHGAVVGIGGDAQASPETTRWHIKADSLADASGDADFRPRRGDQIVSADTGTWVIVSANSETFETRYACECTREIAG
jgi:hypothetical protein